MADLQDKRIAFLVANEGVEQVELTEPWKAVEQAGGTTELISLETGKVQAFNHLDKADTFDVDRTVARRRRRRDYDGLVLPGGVANPDFLRTDERAVAVRARVLRGGQAGRRDLPRPVDARRGRRRRAAARSPRGRACRPTSATPAATGSTRRSSSTRASYRAASPDDLPAFCAKIVEEFAEGRHEGQRATPVGAQA